MAILSSTDRKKITSITGVILILFLVHHSLASMLVWLSDNTFNSFSSSLFSHPPLLWSARFFLLGTFFVHLYYSIYRLKKDQYFSKKVWTGFLILAFTIFHVIWINCINTAMTSGGVRDLALIMKIHFSELLPVIFTSVAIIAVAIHLTGKMNAQSFHHLDGLSRRYIHLLKTISIIVITLCLGLSLYKFSTGLKQ